MDSLVPFINEWFLHRKEYFSTFAQADSRIEGWYKAELLVLLNRLKIKGNIDDFNREANIVSPRDGLRKQVDFKINICKKEHLCELKSLCISQAAGTPRNLHFYFRDDHVGLIKDFKKLDELGNTNKWALAFVYPNPDVDKWNDAVASLPRALKHWRPITKPSDYPEWVYIALWKG